MQSILKATLGHQDPLITPSIDPSKPKENATDPPDYSGHDDRLVTP